MQTSLYFAAHLTDFITSNMQVELSGVMAAMDIKARLQTLMDERGWTIYKVAKEADIPWSTVRNMFKRNTDPSVATLERICLGLGITLAQFFDVENSLGLSGAQWHLLQKWNALDKRDKKLILELLDSLSEK